MKRTGITCRLGVWILALAVLTSGFSPGAESRRRRNIKSAESAADNRQDFNATEMLKRGLEYLEQKQFDQGVKLIAEIPRMCPGSSVRFAAYLALGQHYTEQREYEKAIKNLQQVESSEDEEQNAEALYRTGICYYYLNQYDRAFVSLRKVNANYPWSVYANEAYYYIGLCHFKLGRWKKAVDALKMVGTSVPPSETGSYLSEAGQRLYVKVYDKDLVVLSVLGKELNVRLVTTKGDLEEITLEKLDQAGEYYIGSIATACGKPKPSNAILEVLSGDEVSVEYLDANNAEGKLQNKVVSRSKLVSTASIAFTDGAFNDSVNGVYADRTAFIRVRDLDRDTGPTQDKVTVRLLSRYVPKKTEGESDAVDITASENEPVIRDQLELTLTETESLDRDTKKPTGEFYTGVFTGTLVPQLVDETVQIRPDDKVLMVMQGDSIVVEYEDALHLLGPDPRIVEAKAQILTGDIPDVTTPVYVVDNPDDKARKNLIEAKLYLQLGQIFKDVGLENKAAEKAEEGLLRVDKIISMRANNVPLDRSIVEEAFSAKWDLYLVQNKLKEAIAVCRMLTQLYPTSTLVDQALFKIGEVKMEAGEYTEAISIFSSVLALPAQSDKKAQAQYNIAQIYEQQAIQQATQSGRSPNLSQALLAYQKTADTYPDSPVAGEALEKIADYYISAKDYSRAEELMERIFLEHPDAKFLDTMLLKWAIARYRKQNFQGALQKLDEMLENYPQSSLAPKAKQYRDTIAQKVG